MNSAWQRWCVGVILALTEFLTVRLAHRPEIWMASFEPVWREIQGWPPNDYMQLFEPDAPWRQAARGVKVLLLYKKFIEQATDADLEKVIGGLKQRGIAMAIQGTPLVASKACGQAVEGYGPPQDMAQAAARVKRLGGTIAYVALDEPLYYGHRFDGRAALPYETHPPTPCHATIADLARQTATKMAGLHEIFPDAKIGDVEPVGVYPPQEAADFAADFAQWLDAYKEASGRPFAFVDIDVAWLLPGWPAQFDIIAAAVRKAGIPLGVIYNGTRADASDAAWIASARDHIRRIEQRLGTRPDRVIFQTWTDHPRQMLPETAPDTFTALIRGYVTSR
jgi:hypothetical protein